MAIVPFDWNVVVIGHWNRAILSPAGIAKRLFDLPDTTPLTVLVPLDVVAPYHVRHDRVTVIPSNERLICQPVTNDIENLHEAIGVMRRALADLPRTPVFAAGLNLRYRSEDDVEALSQFMGSPWDDRIDDAKLVVASRSINRSFDWNDAKINVTVTCEKSGACTILLNLDFKSEETQKLDQWLDKTVDEIRSRENLILHGTLGLSPKDFENG